MDQQDRKSKESSIAQLLQQQIENYREILHIEKQLADHLSNSDFEQISKNTEQKRTTMTKVLSNDQQLGPVVSETLTEEGRFSDSETEKLRTEALSLLKEIQALEHDNLRAISDNRKKMLDGFKDAKKAKQVARGYKQTKSIYRSKFDAKS